MQRAIIGTAFSCLVSAIIATQAQQPVAARTADAAQAAAPAKQTAPAKPTSAPVKTRPARTAPRSSQPPPPLKATPDTRGKDAFLNACARCHPPERVTEKRRTKDQWEEVINQMVTSRGATITPDDYTIVLNYLVREYGPVAPVGNRGTLSVTMTPQTGTGPATPPTTIGAAGAPTPPRPRGGAGPDDKHITDPVAAARGRTTYAAACIHCHGTQARGGQGGPNILRSMVLLRDRAGSTLGPFLRQGHQVQGQTPSTAFTEAQIVDLSHFLHERFDDTLRGSPIFTVQNVLTGDRQAGEAWFNGDGGCRACHSPTGDLKGYGAKYDPPGIQQRFLFPRPPTRGPRGASVAATGKPTTVSVTTAGQTVSGVLVQMDDFNVALRDGAGVYRSWKRAPGVNVEKQDPYAAHVALLDRITDKNMHDIVAYLESLK